MGTRLKVLRTFKALHRTRMIVFKDDERALAAARLKINEEFKKNKNDTSEENIQQMIKMSNAVETILRENVLQAEHVGQNKLVLRPRESLLSENNKQGRPSCARGNVRIGLRLPMKAQQRGPLSVAVCMCFSQS
ncbi:hypothetical protein Q7C36_020199 [Tachysurus vachellii]|uniref:LYR motif containing 7 n=1 Tax=Tachysurus vachellii TaxID=175792 RepID=A0AA88LT84_TACVA|nr:hypothetical protein Q7C36_020199 [Tachysurus vachellii]